MTVCNTGTIHLNKPLTQKAADAVNRYIKNYDAESGDDIIEIETYYDSEFSTTLDRIMEELKSQGYTLTGQISYFGDYEGTYNVSSEGVDEIPIEKQALYNATPDELIEQISTKPNGINCMISYLENNGYEITKKTA